MFAGLAMLVFTPYFKIIKVLQKNKIEMKSILWQRKRTDWK